MIDYLIISILILFCFLVKDVLIRIHILLILIFYSIPNLLYRNYDSSLRVDIFGIGEISSDINIQFNLIIFTYIIFLLISFRYSNIKIRRIEYEPKYKFELPIFWALTIIIFSFYFLKLNAINTEGYFNYHLGTLSIEKSFFIVLSEIFFIYFLLKGVSENKFVYNLTYFIYHFLILLTGLRYPALTGILLFFVMKNKIKINLKSISLFVVIIFILSPALILVQRFRNGVLINYEMINTVYSTSYKEIIQQFNFTAETLRAVLVDYGEYSVNIFYGFSQFFLVLFNKIVGINSLAIDLRLENGAFSYVQTYFYRPELVNSGITFGNSLFSESYLYGGVLCLIFVAVLHGIIFKYLNELRNNNNFYSWIIHFYVALPLLKTARGSSIDWLLMAIILVTFLNLLRRIKIL